MASRKFKALRMGEDIISRLPDDALTNILSRLEAKDAVKTSVLSSRWKYLWTFIHNLHFEIHPPPNKSRKRYRSNNFARPNVTDFVDFVEHVVRHCQSKTIEEFHLNTYYSYLEDSDVVRVTELLRSVIDHNVQILTLKFYLEHGSRMVKLPSTILTCKSLVKLTFKHWDPVIDIPESGVCFPNLKFLSMYFHCLDHKFLQKFFRSCPVLEELMLKERFNEYLDKDDAFQTIEIAIPTLKKLRLKLNLERSSAQSHRSLIRAPNLEYLYTSDYFFTIEEDAPFLNKLILNFDFYSMVLFQEGDINAKNLSRAIRSTRGLLLSSSTLKDDIIPTFIAEFPSLHKLIHLYLEFDLCTSFSLLLQFLRNVPNLEVLVLQHIDCGIMEKYATYEEFRKFKTVKSVPPCLLSHLKKIYLFSFEGSILTFIRYLLQNSKVLEKFFICGGCDGNGFGHGYDDKIPNFPRASSSCEIEFVKLDYLDKLKLEDRWV